MLLEYLFEDKLPNFEEIQLHKDIVYEEIELNESKFKIIKFELKGNSLESAKILSKLNEIILTKYSPLVLINGSSAKFNEMLFPKFNEFERKLRMILYMKSTLSNEGDKYKEIIDHLETLELGPIFESLFTDEQFIKNVKSKVNEKSYRYTKKEIVETINDLNENTMWECLLGKNTVPSLVNNFNVLRKYRNDVMHAHNIDYEKYKESMILIEKVNLELTREIENVTDNSKTLLETNSQFNELLNNIILSLDDKEKINNFKNIGEKYITELLKNKDIMIEKFLYNLLINEFKDE